MKVHSAVSRGALGAPGGLPLFTLAVLIGAMICATAAEKGAPAVPAVPAASSTNQVTVPVGSEIPQSVFIIPNSPKDGRNPFFPGSHAELPPTPKPIAPIDASSFVLNGITSPPKRTAMINGRTFEVGEQGEVRVPNGGKELIKCVEIGADSAIIEWKGQQVVLRFRSGP